MTESAEKAYIGTCINVYNSLVLDKSVQLQGNKNSTELIKEHKTWIHFEQKTAVSCKADFVLATGYKPIYALCETFPEELLRVMVQYGKKVKR